MPKGTHRTPVDGTSNSDADRRPAKDRLADPADSGHFNYDPDLTPDDHIEDGIVVVTADVLTAAASPRGGELADPPAAPDVPMPSEPTTSSPGGSGGGSGRSPSDAPVPDGFSMVADGTCIPVPPTDVPARAGTPGDNPTSVAVSGAAGSGRSIGRVIANTALDTALGVPPEVLDERAHAREATEILLEGAADYHRRNKPMPATMLLDLEGIVLHMVSNRGLRSGAGS